MEGLRVDRELAFGPVEQLLDKLDSVEDTKGNAGDRGKLFITNMRVIWQSHAKPRVNLTVGWSCVTGKFEQTGKQF